MRYACGAMIWIDVGQEATEENVKDELRRAVSKCGGRQAAKDIALSVCVSEAAEIASSFFSGHSILVVLDNVWETAEGFGVHSWAATLAEIATSPGSAVIVTTRFISVSHSRGFGSIELGRYDLTTAGSQGWLAAEHLYDYLLGATPKERSEDAYKKDRQEVLEISCGLPIVISTFAALVRTSRRRGGVVGNVLARIRSNVSVLVGRAAGAKAKTMTCHPGIFAVMEECLAHLDEHGVFDTEVPLLNLPEETDPRVFRAKYCDKSGQQLSSRYAALEVMSKSSTRLSFPVLRHVWQVEEADEIAQLFENVGLGRIEEGSDGQDDVFTLHDLQYEYCVSMRGGASLAATDAVVSMPGSASGHALFLSSCESLLLSTLTARGDVCQGWTRFCFAEGPGLSEIPLRQYLTRNLLRHMCCAADDVDDDGVQRTVISLLSDFGWLRGRIAVGGRSSAILECTTALASSSCTSAETGLLTGDSEKYIRVLQESLMLVEENVLKGADGVLAGSLIQLIQSSDGTGNPWVDADFRMKLAHSSERVVRGAWFKPIYGCSPKLPIQERGHGVLAQAVVGSGDTVCSLAALGDGEHFVSGSEDNVVRVHESKNLGVVLELKGHTNKVYCVDVAKREGVEGSSWIFSGSGDGTVRTWEVDLDPVEGGVENVSIVVGDSGSRVWCLSVSNGGDVVAAGCVSGTVFVWKRREGDVERSFEPVGRFTCAGAEKDLGWVRGVAVSRSGDLVVAGDLEGGFAFWRNGGTGGDGTVNKYRASDESGVGIGQVLLSGDDSSVTFVSQIRFVGQGPEWCEVWDVVSRRRRSPRVALPDFKVLHCATLSAGEEACVEGSGARGVLVVGGWDESKRSFISLLSPSNDFKVLSTHSLASAPRSVCNASFGGSKRILIGSDDGCVRMLDPGVSVASDAAQPYEGGTRSLESGCSDASDAPELGEVSTVAVMPAAGLVVAGHVDGQFSLWWAESGELVRAFGDERGDCVHCVDFSSYERLAVSGHENEVALVWDASTWECRFALEGHSKGVVCATISADTKQIVTVDREGELRLWSAEIGGAALLTIVTGLKFSFEGSRGAISHDGGQFLWASILWASRGPFDRNWRGEVIDLGCGRLIWSGTVRHWRKNYWDAFWKEMIEGKIEVPWRFGAVWRNRSVKLRDDDSGQQSADEWRILSGDEQCNYIPRIMSCNCALWSTKGEAIQAATSFSFDSNVQSIAAGWIPAEAGCRRRAVVACHLHRMVPVHDGMLPSPSSYDSARPAIMHFCAPHD